MRGQEEFPLGIDISRSMKEKWKGGGVQVLIGQRSADAWKNGKRGKVTYGSSLRSIWSMVASRMIPAIHANEPRRVSESGLGFRVRREHGPRLSRSVTRNRTPSVGRLRHANTIGTTNSAMSQKIPKPLWTNTIRRAEARRMHLPLTVPRFQSAL